MRLTAASTPNLHAGAVESTLLKLFSHRASVLGIEDMGGVLRMLTLGGEALRHAAWMPGDKIQVQLGGWVRRTYTPLAWDSGAGRTRILACLHTEGPGGQWARGVRVGDHCMVSGPRRSIRLADTSHPAVLFGDETSLGLAAALSDQVSPAALHRLFEFSGNSDPRPAMKQLLLMASEIYVRRADDSHLAEVARRLSLLLDVHPRATLVLTGRASSVHYLNQWLRRQGIDAPRRHLKAHWAEGKAGLDRGVLTMRTGGKCSESRDAR